MPIPKEILAVERPKNTVVYAYGKNKDKYSVKQRTGCRYENGRRIPVTGPTVGHIIDGRYIPNNGGQPGSVSCAPVDLKDWADVVLCDRIFHGMLDELKSIYNSKDAVKIYCISILRVCNPGIKDYELKEAYETGFLSELYPDTALSKNTVSVFLNDLGKACSRITEFMKCRTASINMDHHLLIDGTLKSNDSKVNSLSDFSRKAKTKGTRDISVLYAFDLESMEPICSKCFPGNMLDVTSYEAFIAENGITKGIIVADKGFPSSAAEKQFSDNPELHYLNPVKRNAKVIETYRLHDYDGILAGQEDVLYKKAECVRCGKWLYSFRDGKRASMEERDWLKRAKKNGNYNLSALRNKQAVFGTVVLESDIELTPEDAYKAYASRWEIELVMRFYKSACEFDETRVQDDYSVIATEFCDFLSTVLTFKLLSLFDSKNLLDKMTYKRIMSLLCRAKKVRINDSWQLIKSSPAQIDLLQVLKLIPTSEMPKKRRGRPPQKRV